VLKCLSVIISNYVVLAREQDYSSFYEASDSLPRVYTKAVIINFAVVQTLSWLDGTRG
jgi:hypothetical protein